MLTVRCFQVLGRSSVFLEANIQKREKSDVSLCTYSQLKTNWTELKSNLAKVFLVSDMIVS